MIQDHATHSRGVIDGHELRSVCSRRIADLYDLWECKRDGRLMPSRRDFDIVELKPWLGWLTLIDVLPDALPDGHDFQYRLVGTNFNRIRDCDPTGWRMSESTLVIDRRVMLQNAREICSSRAPRYRYDAILLAKSEIYTPPRLYLPLSDDDLAVNMIMYLGTDPLDAQGRTIAPPGASTL